MDTGGNLMTKARDLANAANALDDVSATELGYLDGVTSGIQTQIDAKQAVVSGVNDTEIGYLDGVTSAIQTQLDAKTAKSTLTTTGDIYYASSANTPARLGIGSTSDVLTVVAGVPGWVAPASSSGPAFSATMSSSQTFSNATNTKLNFNNEEFDTDSCYSTANYRFTPNKEGYYLITGYATMYYIPPTSGTYQLKLYKNGSFNKMLYGYTVAVFADGSSNLVYMNGTTDYLELYGYGDGGGGTQNAEGGATTTIPRFQAHFVRS
jgi:hypothetical protein